jgi:hypothetical protein
MSLSHSHWQRILLVSAPALLLAACGVSAQDGSLPDAGSYQERPDGSLPDSGSGSGAIDGGGSGAIDGGGGGAIDGGGGGAIDGGGGGAIDGGGGGVGIITGGPCLSGASGASAYRVRFANAGGQAQVIYEGNGLPDTSRDHTGVYGYQIGFTSSFVDTFLAEGGLQLNSSSFVDIEISTLGVSSIQSATLSIYGRSYNTTTSGSFHWQTFSGVGSAPTNLVANSAPYEWYSADMLTEIEPNDDSVLLRIKAGPSSGSLAVNRIELCLEAD